MPANPIVLGTPASDEVTDLDSFAIVDTWPVLPDPTPDQEAIAPPDGYPLTDRWASGSADAEAPFAIHPGLRAEYAAIAADDPELALDPQDRQPFPVAERIRGRRWSRFVVEAWPAVFRLEKTHAPHEPGHSHIAHPLGDTWQLHRARIRLASERYEAAEREHREAAKRAQERPCPVCAAPHVPTMSALCPACRTVATALRQSLGGSVAFETVAGKPRHVLVSKYLATQ